MKYIGSHIYWSLGSYLNPDTLVVSPRTQLQVCSGEFISKKDGNKVGLPQITLQRMSTNHWSIFHLVLWHWTIGTEFH